MSNKNCQNCSSNINCTVNGGSQTCNQSIEIMCLSCDIGYYSMIDPSGYL